MHNTLVVDEPDSPGCLEVLCDEDEYVGFDTNGDSHDSESFSDDQAETQPPVTMVSPTAASGRIFHVNRVVRAAGGHRPSIECHGRLVDLFSAGAVCRWQPVVTELTLSLRYEPPSPKFSRTSPDMTSYRLKLLQGTQFIYLLRGFPKLLVLDRSARAIAWGVLQLVFSTDQQLSSFLAVLKHVEVTHDEVWPRRLAALWQCDDGSVDVDGTYQEAASQQQVASDWAGRCTEEEQQQDTAAAQDRQVVSRPAAAVQGWCATSWGVSSQSGALLAAGAVAAAVAGWWLYRTRRA